MSSGIDRIGALKNAFEFVYKSEIRGDYYEFGVYQGVSLTRALKIGAKWSKRTGQQSVVRYFGFDSFEGLPEFTEQDCLDDYKVFQSGQFSDTGINNVTENISKAGLSVENVILIPGFYSDSLVARSTLDLVSDSAVAIAHIDCDLYSSAVDCLRFLGGRLLDGAVILFDDWFCFRGRPDSGVHKAFDEWRSSDKYFVSEYFNYSWAGKAFIVNNRNSSLQRK